MKKFRFRLEKVLKIRKMNLDILQKELAEIKSQLYREQQELENLIMLRTKTEHDFIGLQSAGFEPGEAQMYLRYINGLNGRIGQQRDIVRKYIHMVEQKRLELLKASREKQKIEKLKEKALEEYKQEINRNELIFFDEINTTNSTRDKQLSGREVAT